MATTSQGANTHNQGTTPAIDMINLKKQLARADKYSKALEKAYRTTVRDLKLKSISKDEINSKYDVDNPHAIQEYLNAQQKTIDTEIESALSEAMQGADSYIENEFSDDKVAMQSALAQYNALQNTNLTYDQLTTDIPPRIIKEFEDGNIASMDDLFKTSIEYLEKTGLSKPTAPNVNTPVAPDGTPTEEDPFATGGIGDDAEEYY